MKRGPRTRPQTLVAELGIELGDINNYRIVKRVGRGKYSNVFLGLDTNNNRCIIKCLKPVRPEKLTRETGILQNLAGCPHCCHLLDVIEDPDSGSLALVMDWAYNVPYRTIYPTLDVDDIRIYIYQLLQAVEYAHSLGIMHRDIKPLNIMIDPYKKNVSLIDWGLADYYVEGKQYPSRVATRQYKPPEILLEYGYYDCSIDLWCVGCTMAAMVFRIDILFRSTDNSDQLEKIVHLLGAGELNRFLKKHRIKLRSDIHSKLNQYPGKGFRALVNKRNKKTATASAISLLEELMRFDFSERISATDALRHPFFSPIINQC